MGGTLCSLANVRIDAHRVHTSVGCVHSEMAFSTPVGTCPVTINGRRCCECRSPGFAVCGGSVSVRRIGGLHSAVRVLKHCEKAPTGT